MALPTQLNATEQDTLVKQIGLSLLRAAPRDWRRVTAVYRAVGRYHELTGEVVTADGATQEWVATHDIATLFGKLRAGMYREGRGTWFNARYQLDHPSSYNLEYDRDEPSWDLAPPSQAYADELRMFPRSEENVPDWLMRRMAGLGPERPGPQFRMARIFDGAGPNGPVITRPGLEPDERDRVLAYLDNAPTVGPARGYDVDRLGPDQAAEVPIAFHSDGSWIWPAAVPYYLRTHGVAPESELLQHIRAAGFTVPDVSDETRQAAAAHVAHGQAPQQARPQGAGDEVSQPTTQTAPVTPDQPRPDQSPRPGGAHDERPDDPAAHGASGSAGTGAAVAGAAGIAGVAGVAGAAGSMAAGHGTDIDDEAARSAPADSDAPELPVRRPGKAAQELDEQFSGINGTDHTSAASPASPFLPADRDDEPSAPGPGEETVVNGVGAQGVGTDAAPSPVDADSSATGTARPGAGDDLGDPEAETAAYTLPDRGGDSGAARHDEAWTDRTSAPAAPADGYDEGPGSPEGGRHGATSYDAASYDAASYDAPYDDPYDGGAYDASSYDAAPYGEPLHEQGTAFTPIPTFGGDPRSGLDEDAVPGGTAPEDAVTEHPAARDAAGEAVAGGAHRGPTSDPTDDDVAGTTGSTPDDGESAFDSGPPTTITAPVSADGTPPGPGVDERSATPPMDQPGGPSGQEPPAELEEERTAPTPRQDFDQPAASGAVGAAGAAGALGAAGAVAGGFAGRDDADDHGDYGSRLGRDDRGYEALPPNAHGDDPRHHDVGYDDRGYDDRGGPVGRPDFDDRGRAGAAIDPDPGPPTQIGNMPPQDPELDDLQDKLDELEVPDEYYALGVASDYGWSLERVADGWRVGWYDGELKSTAMFGDAADAKAFMLGKVLLSPDGLDEVPEEQAHDEPEFASEQAGTREPSDARTAGPLLATLTPEIATGTRQVSEEPAAHTRTVSPADDPAGRGGPVPQGAQAVGQEAMGQQATAAQNRPGAGEPQQAARPQSGQGGGQQQAGQQWPIQPLAGEPPLTLFRGKEMRTLPAGSELDRFGGANGNLTYAAGTPFEERSLVPEWVNRPYHVYRVQRPLETLAGVAIPWFNQPGGGAAYLLPASIEELLADGDIIELDPGEPPVD